jgi:hypothetical protein
MNETESLALGTPGRKPARRCIRDGGVAPGTNAPFCEHPRTVLAGRIGRSRTNLPERGRRRQRRG